MSAVLSGRPALAHVADALRQRTLQRLARTKCPENPEQPNIVFVVKERANIDKFSIADLLKRSRNFFFLGCSEEPGALGEFAEFDSGDEMTVNGARNEAAGARDFIDRFALLKPPQRFRPRCRSNGTAVAGTANQSHGKMSGGNSSQDNF